MDVKPNPASGIDETQTKDVCRKKGSPKQGGASLPAHPAKKKKTGQ